MKIGSLFSGIGGLDLGLEQSGHEIVWMAEKDKAASAILARHWPHLENFGDVTEVDWSTVDRPDAICAGNPCPDFSQAGQRKGMAGEQGQLWFEVVRALRTLRPRTVILENVPGIFTSPGLALDSGESALGVVLSDLASLGFMGSYFCLRASDFGACHRRERWFAIAHATSERGWKESGGALKYEAAQNGSAAPSNYVFGSAGQGKLRTATPTHAVSLVGQTPGERYSRPGAGTLERPRGDQGEEISGTAGRSGPDKWGIYWPVIAHWEDICGRRAPEPAINGRLKPEFVEWMLGFPDQWTTGVAKTHRLRCLGNSVQVQVSEHIGSLL